MLQWLRANSCPWGEWTCTRAANGGLLEVLWWSRANGCPWDEWMRWNPRGDILEWAVANGLPEFAGSGIAGLVGFH
jgi:hypothetical protein